MKFSPIVFLHIIAAITAAASGVMSLADTITPLSAVSPQLAHYWPQVLSGALIFDRIGSAILKAFPQQQTQVQIEVVPPNKP